MRSLAQFAMKGRTQAILVAVFAAAIPLMYWASAAVVGLVTLRRGAGEGTKILMWALLPAIFWFNFGDITPLLVLLGTFGLAIVLRESVSWQRTLAAGLPLGVLAGVALETLQGDLLRQLAEVTFDMFSQSASSAGTELEATALNSEVLFSLLVSGLTAMHLVMMLTSLVLARYWQAALYNPGGFATEFHQVKLPPLFVLGLFIALYLSVNMAGMGTWLPMLLVPLVFAGLALIHGTVAKRKMNRSWLVLLYVAGIVLGPYVITMLVVLAAIDSVVDIRRRLPASH